MSIDLSKFNNSWYSPGKSVVTRIAWYVTNAVFFDSWLLPWSRAKRALLRRFGACVGKGVVIKPRVSIKYPWLLRVGDFTWLGEGVWIDNLAEVRIGSNVCISQEALLLTGNHDFKDPNFGLMIGTIVIEDGAWVGARSTLCPGVTVGREAMVVAGSVLTTDAEPGWIYRGNPASRVRERVIGEADSGNRNVQAGETA